MRPQFIIRLIDLTLLLLLSLLSVARMSEDNVVLPQSTDIEDVGEVPLPVEVIVERDGAVYVVDAAARTPMGLEELAAYAEQRGRPIELRVDGAVEAEWMLQIHRWLQSAGASATFLVEQQR